MLLRQVGDVVDVPDGQRWQHEGILDEGRIGGLLAHPLHPLRVQQLGGRQLRHAVAQQQLADVVEPRHRHAAPRRPVGVEAGGHAARHRPGHQHIAVAEVVLAVPVVVVVLVVAPADHPDRIVHHQQLVVHALVEVAETAQHAGGVVQVVGLGQAEGGVVDAQREVLVRAGQRAEDLQVGDRRQLVDQHPHLHAAARRGQQFVHHQPRAVVLVEDVGLQVDAAAGAADQVDPRHQRFLAVVQDGGVVARRGAGGGLGEGLAGHRAQRRGQRAVIALRAVDAAVARGLGDRHRAAVLGLRQARATAAEQQRRQHQDPQQQCHGASAAVSRARSTKVTRSLKARSHLSIP